MTNSATSAADPAASLAHTHAADLEACLDFINTRAYTDGVPEERIPTLDDAVAYFTLRGLGHEEALRRQASADVAAWLGRLYASRGALREVWDAEVEGRMPALAALDEVNELLRHAPRVELVPGPGGVGVGHRHVDDDPTGEALARIAQPLVEAIAAGDTDRFRICANDGCRWVFADTSRAGRRRWCDDAERNRANVRRFRSRRKAATGGSVPALATDGRSADRHGG